LASFYGLLCGSGGGFTGSGFPDARSGAETAVSLWAVIDSGVNLVFQACGMLESTMSMSLEKFLLDEEICGNIQKILSKCVERRFADQISPSHLAFMESSYDQKTVLEQVDDQLTHRLATYAKPDIEPDVEQDLAAYVNRRKIN
jgi:trimethylamine--corrinoid protein Co-methyltransferase